MVESDVHRHLAAILVADAVGYTRLMQDDERATVAALDSCRAIFRDRIEANGGRVVDMAGDSVLAVFETATGAVRCAIDTQDALVSHNETVADDRRMRFRVGVTLGEIIEKADGSVYGDGINIAARLQAKAEPDAINISGTVSDSVRGKIKSGFDYLGEHDVKNIDTPVRVYRIVAGDAAPPPRRAGNKRVASALGAAAAILLVVAGIASWQAGWIGGGVMSVVGAAQFRPSLPDGPSIAVLPFENLSGDPGQDYFADGLTEDVIAALGRFSNLSVLARNATAAYKDAPKAPAEIGRELGVRYLLEGSVRRVEQRVRVNTQLTDAETGLHLWSNRYDTDFDDLFSVQDDITRNVAGALAVELRRVEIERATHKPTKNMKAYDYVLRGWELLKRSDRSATYKAREMFQRAIEIDPDYATAYAGLGASHENAVALGYTEFIEKGLEQAERLANMALDLEPDNVRALVVLAAVHEQKGESDLAASRLRRALEINPSDADSYKEYASILVWGGHEQKAIEWFEAALRLDPQMAAASLGELGLAYYLDGRYEDALARARESLSRESEVFWAPIVSAAALGQLGRMEEEAAAARDVYRVRPFFTIEWFTAALSDPIDAAHTAEGLRKAGLSQTDKPN